MLAIWNSLYSAAPYHKDQFYVAVIQRQVLKDKQAAKDVPYWISQRLWLRVYMQQIVWAWEQAEWLLILETCFLKSQYRPYCVWIKHNAFVRLWSNSEFRPHLFRKQQGKAPVNWIHPNESVGAPLKRWCSSLEPSWSASTPIHGVSKASWRSWKPWCG